MSIDETEWINEINKCMDQKEKWYLQRIKNLEKRNIKLVQKMHILEKQLEIATKALEEYKRCENGSYANKALTLIKEVK